MHIPPHNIGQKKKQTKPISNKREHQSVMEGGEKEDKVEGSRLLEDV